MDTNQTSDTKESSEAETPHKHAGTAAVMIAGCALLAFTLAALCNAAWAGAAVAGSFCLMGLGTVYFIMRRA